MKLDKNIKYKPVTQSEYNEKFSTLSTEDRLWHKNNPGKCLMSSLGHVCLKDTEDLHYLPAINDAGYLHQTWISDFYLASLARGQYRAMEEYFK